jgi:exopolyphosphatase/guanosine-5'-triphosphate,3'-diphosphate pyrophosphatase
MAVYAAIDIGTNTLRLLVAETVGPDDYTVLHEEQQITRLGEGLRSTGLLQDAPRRRSLTVLKRFADLARSFKAGEVAAVATSAVREARNGEEFVAEVGREAGLALRVIDGREEARLTLLGVRHGLRPGLPRILVMDIGGGSTEYVLARGEVIEGIVSTGLGVVKLTEQYLVSDPPTVGELRKLEDAVGTRVDRLRRELSRLEEAQLVGTAGTVTTLAAIDLALVTYDRGKVHGHRLTRARVRELLDRLAALALRERRQVPGLEPGRADIILAGAAILAVSMERLGYHELRVSNDGLREGILLDLIRGEGRTRLSGSA